MRPLAGADNHVSEATTTTARALPARASSAADHALPPFRFPSDHQRRGGHGARGHRGGPSRDGHRRVSHRVPRHRPSRGAPRPTPRGSRAPHPSLAWHGASPPLAARPRSPATPRASSSSPRATHTPPLPVARRAPRLGHSGGAAPSPYAAAARLVDPDEATKDAMFGSLAYALLGRGVRTALPSDVSHPGALARRSMPSNGATRHRRAAKDPRGLASQRRVPSLRISVRSRHRRPHAAQQDGVRERGGGAGGAEGTWKVRLWNFLRMVPKQRFYPQCRKCSDAQSVAVRAGKKMLVQHGGAMKLGAVVATAVAARQYARTRHPEEYAAFERKLERFPLWA